MKYNKGKINHKIETFECCDCGDVINRTSSRQLRCKKCARKIATYRTNNLQCTVCGSRNTTRVKSAYKFFCKDCSHGIKYNDRMWRMV